MSPCRHDLHLLSGAYALDALDGSEHATFERHLAHCSSCAEEVRGLTETAARLPMATAIEPSAEMREQVLPAATRTRQLPPSGCKIIPLSAYRTGARRAVSRPGIMITITTMAAAIVALLVVQISTQHQLRTAQAGTRAIAAVLSAPDARLQTGAATTGGTVTAVISARDHEAVITTSGMPAQSGGRVYQLWVISASGARSVGLLPASTSGSTALVLASGMLPGDKLGITIEPAGGTTQPTTAPIALMSSTT